jgi:hypothetical protein
LNEKVDVIGLDVELVKIPTLRLTALTKKFLKTRGDSSFQNTMAVLGAKDKVDKNSVTSMTTTPIMDDRLAGRRDRRRTALTSN